MEPISRKIAIKVINEIFESHFGCDKGSDEMYCDFMENLGLSKYDENGNTLIEAPGQYEFFLALGITPQEIVDTLRINYKIFNKQLCEIYKMKKPKKFKTK